MLVSHISLCFIKKTKCSLFFLQLWLKPDKARTSRGRNNIVYRMHFPRCAFCGFSPLCILGFKKFTSSLKCSQLSEPSDQQETLFDFPIAKVGQNEKVDTTYGESAPLPKEPEGSFPKRFLSQAPRSIAVPLSRWFSLLAPQ